MRNVDNIKHERGNTFPNRAKYTHAQNRSRDLQHVVQSEVAKYVGNRVQGYDGVCPTSMDESTPPLPWMHFALDIHELPSSHDGPNILV